MNESNIENVDQKKEYDKITIYPYDDQNMSLNVQTSKNQNDDEFIQKEIKKQEKELTNIKYVFIKSNSNYIFYSLLIIFIILISVYIYFKFFSKTEQKDNSQVNNNFKFYNHTGWSQLTPKDPVCNLFGIEKIGNDYIIDYDNERPGLCLDAYYVTGTKNTTRKCESDICKDFDGNDVLFGETKLYDFGKDTPLPTCNLEICEDKIFRIISFVDNVPFCATITYSIENNEITNNLDPTKTAFLVCDPLDRNQLFRIKRKSSYGGDPEKGSIMDIISRTTQEYLYIDKSGFLALTPNKPLYSWVYSPTIQISDNIIIPSQLVYMDYDKLNEFPQYTPLNEEPFNILNIPRGYNYTNLFTNLYSLSNFGYLSARQYQQFCLLEGVGNTACYHELMIILESEYQILEKNKNLVYEYRGDL